MVDDHPSRIGQIRWIASAVLTLLLLAYTRPWPISLVWQRPPLSHFIDDNFAELLAVAETNEWNGYADPVSEVLPEYASHYLAEFSNTATPPVRVPGDVEKIDLNAAPNAYRPHMVIFSDGGSRNFAHPSEVAELEKRRQTLLSIGVRNQPRSSDVFAITLRQLFHLGHRKNPDNWKYSVNPMHPPVR